MHVLDYVHEVVDLPEVERLHIWGIQEDTLMAYGLWLMAYVLMCLWAYGLMILAADRVSPSQSPPALLAAHTLGATGSERLGHHPKKHGKERGNLRRTRAHRVRLSCTN